MLKRRLPNRTSQCHYSMQDPNEIQRLGLSYHLSKHRRNLRRKGITRLGSQCEPAALFYVQVAGFRRAKAHHHHIVPSRQIHKNPKGNCGGCVNTSGKILLSYTLGCD